MMSFDEEEQRILQMKKFIHIINYVLVLTILNQEIKY